MKKLVWLLMTFLATQAFAELKRADGIKALVNEDVILESELDNRIEEIKARYKANPEVLPPNKVLEKQILDLMITESIQLQMAAKQGWTANKNRLKDALENVARNANMTIAELEKTAEFDQISEQLSRDLLINRTRQAYIRDRINITPKEIDSYLDTNTGRIATAPELLVVYYRTENKEDADKVYTKLQAGAQLLEESNAIKIDWRLPNALPSILQDRELEELKPLDAIQPFFNNNQWHLAQLLDKRSSRVEFVDQVNARHILIQPNQVLNEDAARTLAQSLRQRVLEGESFSDLAREFSDDTGSKADGGELGWSDPANYVENFRNTIQALEPGEMSDVFKTDFGFHFLEVLGKRQQDVGLQELKDSTYRTLYSNKFNEELQRWLIEIREAAFVDIRP